MSTRHRLVFLVGSGRGGELSSAPSAADGPAPTQIERPHIKTVPDAAAVPAGQIWLLPARYGVEAFRHVCGARGEYRSGTSDSSENDLDLQFGLGQVKFVDELTVRWPARDLPETRLELLSARRRDTIELGKGITKVEEFAR
jgi:hypothetical protein